MFNPTSEPSRMPDPNIRLRGKQDPMFPKEIDVNVPVTIEDAVDLLLEDLPLLDRSRMANMTDDELDVINRLVGLQISKDFRLWSGNDELLNACMQALEEGQEEETDPTLVIVRAMWEKLQTTHKLRLVR